VQIYLEKPCGVLGNPARVLAGFAKTKSLAPQEREEVQIIVPKTALASYDDRGVTGFCSAYVTEAGTYRFYLGRHLQNSFVKRRRRWFRFPS